MSREIVDRLNELLECERAGVETALGLGASAEPGFTRGELKKFAEDEGWDRRTAPSTRCYTSTGCLPTTRPPSADSTM